MAEGSTGTVDCCHEHARQTSDLTCPPATDANGVGRERRERAMDVLHPRCAGIDVSKKDAKVCVRIVNGAGTGRSGGRRDTGVTETVTTWGSMTRQILDL